MKRLLATTLSVFLIACAQAQSDLPFEIQPITSFDEPWAMAFLPDGRMLVTEKKGNLYIVNQQGQKTRAISGVPDVDYGGQGGLGDVALHPDFEDNNMIYLSYAEAGPGNTRGAAVARAIQARRGRGIGSGNWLWRRLRRSNRFWFCNLCWRDIFLTFCNSVCSRHQPIR